MIIEGLALIEEVNEELNLELSDPHYDTIAGYVLGKLNRMAKLGDVVEIGGGKHMEVIKLDGMRIEQLSLGQAEATSKSDD